MLAGAPSSRWQQPCLGAELFESRSWETHNTEIRDVYLKQWAGWQSEGPPHVPGRVATTFSTTSLGSFPFTVQGSPWELRLSRVEPTGADWLDWHPVAI